MMKKILMSFSSLAVMAVLALASAPQAFAGILAPCVGCSTGWGACDGTNTDCYCTEADCYGTDGDDHMCGDGSNQVFYGGKGDDIICGGGGDDSLHGGWGNDCLYGEGDDDDLYGGHCADYFDGGAGTDVCKGGWGDDDYISCDFDEGKVDDHKSQGDCTYLSSICYDD